MASNTKLTNLDTSESGFKVEGSSKPDKTYNFDVGSDPAHPNDISPATKSTLGAYLSRTTLAKSGDSKIANKYPLDHNEGTPVNDFALTDTKGYPVGPQTSANTAQFDKEMSKPSRSPAAANIEILKGRQQPTDTKKIDGNELLRFNTTVDATSGKQTLPQSSPITKYSSSLLKNRFVPDTKFETVGDEGQYFARKYAPGTSKLDISEDKRRVSYDQLAQLGPELTKLSGLNPDSVAAAVRGYTPPAGTNKANGLAESTRLSLTQVETNLLSARSVLENLPEVLDPNYSTKLSIADKSWTSMNSVFDNYSGMSSSAMHTLALALIRSAAISLKILADTLQGFDLSNRSAQRKDGVGRQPYGSYEAVVQPPDYNSISGMYHLLTTGQATVWDLVGIQSTQSKFSECLSIGAMAFFGIDGGLNTNDHLSLDTKPNAGVQNPGFDAVNSRAISRALLVIGDAFSTASSAKNDILSLGAEGSTSQNERLIASSRSRAAAATKAFNVLMSLRDSKAVSILNVMAQLGDSIVSYKGYTNDIEVRGIGKRHSSVDRMPNIDAASKNRLRQGQLKLAWSAHRSIDAFIVPSVVLNAALHDAAANKILGAPTIVPTEVSDEGSYGELPGYKAVFRGSNYITDEREVERNRIRTEFREQIEQELDAEYVPFYFHDVRTNEIVSFHAFLTKLSDDITASYDSVEGFGRVEPIKIYKNTVRKISLSFIVAAMDEKDFDSMWTKINKLTTLLYPQYTEGTQIRSADGKYSFYQPFSQMISASPMTRLRIGDIIQSNYSKFNLARLFGYGLPNTNFGGENDGNVENSGIMEQRMLSTSRARQLNQRILSSYGDLSYYKNPASRFYTSSVLSDPYYSTADAVPSIKPRSMLLPKGLLLKYVASQPQLPSNYSTRDWAVYEVVLATSEDDPSVTPLQTAAMDRYADFANPEELIIGQKYLFSFSELTPTKDTVAKALALASTLQKNTDWVAPPPPPAPPPPADPEIPPPEPIPEKCGAKPRRTAYSEGYPGKKPAPSPDVIAWQTYLSCKGYRDLLGPYGEKDENGVYTGIDGLHGPNTENASKAYEEDERIAAEFLAGSSEGMEDMGYVAQGDNVEFFETDPKLDTVYGTAPKTSVVTPQAAAPAPPLPPLDPTPYKSKYVDMLNDFMNDDLKDNSRGNAVVKSFRTVGGRGLAGFIESMNFTWIDNRTTWAGVGSPDGIGSRAPKMCEISISFSPIHDISPGIDSQGYNRAPIYPVGPHAPMTKKAPRILQASTGELNADD